MNAERDADVRADRAIRMTVVGAAVNVVLLAVKFAAGIAGRSQAMVADAVHTLSDFATDVAVLVGIRYARKPRDADHAYGHGKYETLAAAFVGLTLALVGLRLGWNALHTLFDAVRGEAIPRPSPVAFWAACLSIAVKEALFHQTVRVGRATGNDAVVANAWHHRSDALSSIGTAVGVGAAAFLGAEWTILDPIAAIGVSVLLLQVAFVIVKAQLGGLTEQSLPAEFQGEIAALALSFPDISYPHNLRTRRVGRTVVIDLHVRVAPDMCVAEAHDIVSELEAALRRRFGPDTIASVHIEPRKDAPGVAR